MIATAAFSQGGHTYAATVKVSVARHVDYVVTDWTPGSSTFGETVALIRRGVLRRTWLLRNGDELPVSYPTRWAAIHGAALELARRNLSLTGARS